MADKAQDRLLYPDYDPFSPEQNVDHPMMNATPRTPKQEFGPLGTQARIKQGFSDLSTFGEDRREEMGPLWESGRLLDPSPVAQSIGWPRMTSGQYYRKDLPPFPATQTESEYARSLGSTGQIEAAHQEDLRRIVKMIGHRIQEGYYGGEDRTK